MKQDTFDHVMHVLACSQVKKWLHDGARDKSESHKHNNKFQISKLALLRQKNNMHLWAQQQFDTLR